MTAQCACRVCSAARAEYDRHYAAFGVAVPPSRGRWMSEPLTKGHGAGFVVGWVLMDVAFSLAGLR